MASIIYRESNPATTVYIYIKLVLYIYTENTIVDTRYAEVDQESLSPAISGIYILYIYIPKRIHRRRSSCDGRKDPITRATTKKPTEREREKSVPGTSIVH